MSLDIVGRYEFMPSVYTEKITVNEDKNTINIDYVITDYYDHNGNPTWASQEFLNYPIAIKTIVSTNALQIQINKDGDVGSNIALGSYENSIGLGKLLEQATEIRSYNFKDFSASFKISGFIRLDEEISSIENLVVYSYIYLNTSELIQNVDEAKSEFVGPVVADVIKENGRYREQSFNLLDNGNLYRGPFHQMPTGEIMKNSFHSNNFDTLLQKQTVLNKKIKIFRYIEEGDIKQIQTASNSSNYVSKPLYSYEYGEAENIAHGFTRIDLKRFFRDNFPILNAIEDSLVSFNYLNYIKDINVEYDNRVFNIEPIKINFEDLDLVYCRFAIPFAKTNQTVDINTKFRITLNPSTFFNNLTNIVIVPLENVFSQFSSYFILNELVDVPSDIRQNLYQSILKAASIVLVNLNSLFSQNLKNILDTPQISIDMKEYVGEIINTIKTAFETFQPSSQVNSATQYDLSNVFSETLKFSTTNNNLSYFSNTNGMFKNIIDLKDRLKKESLRVTGNSLIHDNQQYLLPGKINGVDIMSGFDTIISDLNEGLSLLAYSDDTYGPFDPSNPYWDQLDKEAQEGAIYNVFTANLGQKFSDEYVPYVIKAIAYTILYEEGILSQSAFQELYLDEFYAVLYGDLTGSSGEKVAKRRLILTNILLNLRQIQVLKSSSINTWEWETLTIDMFNEMLLTPNSFTIMRLNLDQDTRNLIESFFPTPNGTGFAGHEDHTVDDPYYILSSEDITIEEYTELSNNFEQTEDFVDDTSSWIFENSELLEIYDNDQVTFSFTSGLMFNVNRLSVLDNQFEPVENDENTSTIGYQYV